jgi:hypothetical protein
VFIPIKLGLYPYTKIENHPGYLSKNNYINNHYTELPESKNVNKIAYGKNADGGKVWSIIWGSLGLASMVTGIVLVGAKEDIAGGITLAAWPVCWVISAFGTKSVKVPINDNIKANQIARENVYKEYDILYNKWQQETDAKNEEIQVKNDKIKQDNDLLPAPSVTYEKK